MANRKQKDNYSKMSGILLICLLVGGILIGGVNILNLNKEDNDESDGNSNQVVEHISLSEKGDLVIPINEITEQASFYPLEVDGIELEVLAIKAPDGTIRTAFNTCQICYASGRGYYKQSGDVLICQNCGNRFSASEVEITRGGCNPVPIFEDEKVVNDEEIIIPNELLLEAAGIFTNWKNEYL